MVQAVLRNECVRQFLLFNSSALVSAGRVPRGDQWLEGYNVKGVLRWFPSAFS